MSTVDARLGPTVAPPTRARRFDRHRMWVVARTELRQLLLSKDYWIPMVALGSIFFLVLPAVLLLIVTSVGDISVVQQASHLDGGRRRIPRRRT